MGEIENIIWSYGALPGLHLLSQLVPKSRDFFSKVNDTSTLGFGGHPHTSFSNDSPLGQRGGPKQNCLTGAGK